MTVTTDNSQTLVNALVEIERLNDRLLMVEAILAGNGALITGLKAEVARLEPLQYRQAPCHHQGSRSMTTTDPVNHPPHYTNHPSGVECIQVVEHMGFNLGNAIKYIWRSDLKHDAIEDLRKARWYVEREIQKRIKVEAAK